ncbi:MAG TPA: DUF2461 domain-containing protein, partial [Flavobacteriales bacterium]|nr:DUF2461 domain-containing protein [Flavobacteriales bacterium]
WFDANKKRYETVVKKPFEAFVAEAIARVAKVDKRVRIEPKEAIFRINRDVRFSNDKTPYKLSRSALITAGGRKDMNGPGIYFELGPGGVNFYGGAYAPDKDQLKELRERIMDEPKKFKALYQDETFVKLLGTVQGERNKVLPAEYKEAAAKEPLLFNKQFYYGAELPAKMVTDPKLADILMTHYNAMRPMGDFLLGK